MFFPKLVQYLARDSIEFLDKEPFTDVTEGERHEVDLVIASESRVKSRERTVRSFRHSSFDFASSVGISSFVISSALRSPLSSLRSLPSAVFSDIFAEIWNSCIARKTQK